MTTIAQPSTGEWVAAAVAAGLVVVLGALHLVRPVLARSEATRWGRLGGFLLGVLTAGFVLCVVVLLVGAAQFDEPTSDDRQVVLPDGEFAGVLLSSDPVTADRLAGYVAAVLLPAAAVLAVLAIAVIDVGRTSALRVVAAVLAGLVLGTATLVAIGDGGSAATGTAWAAAVVAAAAAAAFVIDELEARQPSRSSRSSPSTTRSQRSAQSLQR
jgi:hypothetical protein